MSGHMSWLVKYGNDSVTLNVLDENSDAKEPGVTLSKMISGAAEEIEVFLIHSNLFRVI